MTTLEVLRAMRVESDLPKRVEIRSISLAKFAELVGLSIEQIVQAVENAKQTIK